MRRVLRFATLVAASLLLSQSSRASDTTASLVVRTYDRFGVAAGELAAARATASSLLELAGIRLVWRDCSAGCADPPGPRDVLLRIVAAPEAAPPGSLGYSLVDLQQARGTLATVYADRIEAAAGRTGGDAGRLLGRAAAHEIGHLLLGTSDHGQAGLMRPLWLDRELKRDRAADWTWSPEEMARLGRRAQSTFRPPASGR